MELASIPARIIAWLVDAFILGFIAGTIFNIFGTPYFASFTGLLLIEWVLYHGFFWTRYNGQTPGKMLVGIRVIKKDDSAILWADSVVRCFGYVINSVLFNLGWLSAFFDGERQGIQDKLAQTYVVKVSPRRSSKTRN